ncbi:MAG: nicotinate (nicotinamide) nucleotide adenylyltransferase [FCB group bacterium]|jgi:nicotinate-nucleotide adenylyltransferase
MKKIGIIGGTFNPVHLAHLIIAEQFTNELQLDTCYFFPCFISPFKTDVASKTENVAEHRLQMLKLATQSNPKFIVDDFEIVQKGISYTYNTILYLKEKEPDSKFYLLIGSDQALSFKQWSNWEKILESVQVCVAFRADDLEKEPEIIDILMYKFHTPIILHSPIINISASQIREKIKQKNSIKSLVPDTVEDYIYSHKLYL